MYYAKKIINSLVDFDKLRILNEKKPFLIAFILFVSSLGIITSHVILLSMIFIIISSKTGFVKISKELKVILVIAALSFLNECIHIFENDYYHVTGYTIVEPGFFEIIPYSLLIFVTIWASKVSDTRILKWIVVLSIFEIFVGIWERSVGINSLFPDSAKEMGEFGEGALLYDFKVNGLGVNSTSIGYKSFLSLLLFERFPGCRFMKRWLFVLLCVIGTVLSFNRTSMIGILVYFVLFSLNRRYRVYSLILLFCIICFIVYMPAMYNDLLTQVTRGGTEAANMLSGREDVFPLYIDFIKSHVLMGNGSFKLFFQSGDIMFHAHNAYLQTLATNGVIISFLYLLLIFIIVNKFNFKYAFPILVCGLFQTFILWGTSLNDFVFYTLLLNNQLSQKQIC